MSLWTSTDEQAGKPLYDNGADVFGIDTTEITVETSDNVVAISIISAGTGYASAPDVEVGGNTESTATVASGKVTALSITGTNTLHTTAPAVTIDPPVAKAFHGASDVGSNAITETAHGFATGDALTYAHSSGGVVVGLTTATVYYAILVDADTLSLALTYADAIAGTVIVLDDGSGSDHSLTGTTATATASLGEGISNITHTGWNKRTVGTGGRANRVFWECLVAGGMSDDDEDIAAPDA